jgi:hypothetical protein
MIEPRLALPATIALTPEQAKLRLLELGEEAEAARQERKPLQGAGWLVALIAAITGAYAAGLGTTKKRPGALGLQEQPKRGPGFAIPLSLIIRILRPALPIILRYFAQRREVRQQRAAAESRRPRAYAQR